MCLFVWVDLKNAADTVVMIPLLYKLFFVRYRVSLDEILELRKVRCEQYTASHDGKTLARDLPGLAQLFDQDRRAGATYTIACMRLFWQSVCSPSPFSLDPCLLFYKRACQFSLMGLVISHNISPSSKTLESKSIAKLEAVR